MHSDYGGAASTVIKRNNLDFGKEKLVSFLPLSHVAAQIIDLVVTLHLGMQVYFASNTALQGTILDTMKEVRPTIFFSVPRLWEKIEERMKLLGSQSGPIKRGLANWAKSIGKQGTYAELNNLPTPFCP